MNLAITFRSELLKTKRTSAFYLTLFGGFLGTFLEVLEMLSENESVQRFDGDPWQIYFAITIRMTVGVMLPLYIILISTLLAQIEYRNHTWKQVFSSPQSELAVFLSKFLSLQLLVIIFLLMNTVFLTLGALLLNAIYPKLDLLHHYFDWQRLGGTLLSTFIGSLAVSAIQFWMSLRFRNFILPIAVGFVLWIAGVMMMAEYESFPKEWYPYIYPMMIVFPGHEDSLYAIQWNSAGIALVLLLLGFLDFKHRKGKG
jgi:hypothetical protein